MPVSHDALAYREAETFSRTDALCGEERLKDVRKILRWDAGAIVDDFHNRLIVIGGILMRELFHHREACGGISAEQMPKAFFKMSRCRLTYSSSCRRRRSSRCSGVSKASVLGSLSIWPSSARPPSAPVTIWRRPDRAPPR